MSVFIKPDWLQVAIDFVTLIFLLFLGAVCVGIVLSPFIILWLAMVG